MNPLYLIAFLSSAALSAVLTPVAIWLGYRYGITDGRGEKTPSGQSKITKANTPRTGGIGVFFGTLIPFIIISGFDPASFGIVAGAIIIWIFMLIDDKFNLPPWMKFLGQIFAATAVVLSGMRIAYLTNIFGSGWVSLDWLSIPLTYIWIILVTNAVNFIDGLDGLASGITVIVCITAAVASISRGMIAPALLLISLAGACGGFLPFNFKPAKVFLGDNGAHLIGFIISVCAIWGTAKATTAVVLGVSAIALAIPMFDVFYSALRRVAKKKSPFSGDMDNIHYKLLKLGWSEDRVVLAFYVITALFSILALYFFVWR